MQRIIAINNRSSITQKKSKSNISDESEEDELLYEFTIAASVAAVTARDHAPRRRNVIV